MDKITKEKALEIFMILDSLFPNASCELNYSNPFEMLIATILSAQTTDISVNKVTSVLFKKYPDSKSLKDANLSDVINIIKPLGLYQNKAKNIIKLAEELETKYQGEIIADYNVLITLPGVGRKTANVVLSEVFDIPAIAVDTHVLRVSNILKLSDSDNPIKVENDLMSLYDKSLWKDVHLKLLFFGRYMCKAIKPLCSNCPFNNSCHNKYK